MELMLLEEPIYHLPDVVRGLHNDWMEFLRDKAPRLIAIILVGLILLYVIRLVTSRMAQLGRGERRMHGGQQLRTIASVLHSIGTFVIIFIAMLQTLDIFHINIAPLLASAGVAGLAIGFGAQTLVKDVITGFFLLLENQFDIGDTVKIASVSGTVEAMRLRTTILRDANGTLHMVPNGQITIVSNLTRDWSAVNIHVAVDYGEDSERVVSILREACEQVRNDDAYHDDLVSEIEVPGIEHVSGREVDYLVTAKVRPGRQYAISRELRRRIKEQLAKNNIKAGLPGFILTPPEMEKT